MSTLSRAADFTFITAEPALIARVQRHLASGKPMHTSRRAWVGMAYVIKYVPYFSPFDGLSCTVTLRPTGRPCGVDYGTAPGRTVITSRPKPSAGTVAQRIYGVPVLQSALDKMREHIKVSTQLAVQRAAEDLMIYGKSPSSLIIDDPLVPLGTPESRERIKHWYNDVLGRRHEFHPNCRCLLPVGITTKERSVKIRNKYYVAAPSVTSHSEQDQENVCLSTSPNDRSGRWTRRNLEDAVAHGEAMLASNLNLEHVAIVKIIKVVRRPKPKYVVEDVK